MSEHINPEENKESEVSNHIEDKVFEDSKKEEHSHEHSHIEEKHHEHVSHQEAAKEKEETKKETKEEQKAEKKSPDAKKGIKKVHKKKSSHTTSKSKKSASKKEVKKSVGKRKNKNKTLIWKILAIIIALAIIIGIIIFAVNKNSTQSLSSTIVAKTGLNITPDNSQIDQGDLVIGAKDAPITIYVYSDFLCPYCKRFAEQTEGQIIDKYVKTGYAKIVPKQFVVHGDPALKLAVVAICAGEKGVDYYQNISAKFFSDTYFQSIDDAKLKTIIESSGLNYTEISACVDSNKYASVVQQDIKDGQAAGVSGTPSISINGNLIVGAQPFSTFDAAIQSLISGKSASSAKNTNTTVAAPGTDTSKDPKSTFYVISDNTCPTCNTTQVIAAVTQKYFPNVKLVELDYNNPLAKDILNKTGIKMIPAYIFSSDIVTSANYPGLAQSMIEEGGYVYINPAATGSQGRLLDKVDIGTGAVKGNTSAKVTIVEFGDYQCPYCGAAEGTAQQLIATFKQSYPSWEAPVPNIMTQYVDTGKVLFVFRNYPLPMHPDAEKAAEAAECARDQGQFWQMHDKLFENQNALNVSFLKTYASDLGLNTIQFDTCLDNGNKAALVANDAKYGASIGVSGTPAFYIDETLISGALPFSEFQKDIDAELAKNN